MHKLLDAPRDTTTYVISGTDTFRLGSRKLLGNKIKRVDNNFGGNRANLDKAQKYIWKADKGYTLVQVDQGGAEALIVSYLCRDAKYRSLFKHGIKPHNYLGLKLFPDVWKQYFDPIKVDLAIAASIPELSKLPFWKELAKLIASSDDWEPTKRYYHFSKKTIHAGSYGMMANTFRTQLLKESGGEINLTFAASALFLTGLHTEFPELKDWHGRTYETAKTKKQLRNLFDYPYNITHYIKDNDYKDLIAWVPQSTVACITRQAYVKLQELIEKEKLDWHLLHDTHDSYMSEVPDNDVMECAKIMKDLMAVELQSPLDGEKFRMKSSASIGKNWGPRKEKKKDGIVVSVENPDGLYEISL
jgi:hypothetical protein